METTRSLLHVHVSDLPRRSEAEAGGPTGSVLDFIASDESLDRYREIISASGWKLENYQRNPVFQNSHQCTDILHTLGRALITEVRDGQLRQRIQFATDINPMAKIAFNLYKAKFLNAVSVGFRPIRWEDGSDRTSYRRKYLEQELMEVSAVSIPANPNALALAYKSGAVEKSDLRDLSDLITLTLGKDAVPASLINSAPASLINSAPASQIIPSDTCHQTPDPSPSPLLQLARSLHDTLRKI